MTNDLINRDNFDCIKSNLLLDNIENLIVITDEDVNIIYVNKYVMDFTGYDISELIGKNPRIFKSKKLHKKHYKKMWEDINNNCKVKCKFINKKKSGEEYLELKTIIKVEHEGIINYVSIGIIYNDFKNFIEEENGK